MQSLNAVHELSRVLLTLSDPDDDREWPGEQLNCLAAAGGNRWNIPAVHGGDEFSHSAMLETYRVLASSSLLTAFILTQRNAACQRIETSSNTSLASDLLPRLGRGELFTTVGISHLTTSRQHISSPAVIATPSDNSRRPAYRLTGSIPWVTGASRANVLVTGGTLADNRQILAAVPIDRRGVFVREPIRLMGLSSSMTAVVDLDDVEIEQDKVLHGPVERVMSSGAGGGAGSLVTSAVALGAAQGWLSKLETEAGQRAELSEFVCELTRESIELQRLLTEQPAELSADDFRRAANSLAIRTAQSWLATTKGAGYVAGHPAERAVRESMFFLVWSCPQTVLHANLRELTCRPFLDI